MWERTTDGLSAHHDLHFNTLPAVPFVLTLHFRASSYRRHYPLPLPTLVSSLIYVVSLIVNSRQPIS